MDIVELNEIEGQPHPNLHKQNYVISVELEALRAAPTPSADIEQRICAYVEATARPTISGIGKGERLKVIWPGAGWDSSGLREHRKPGSIAPDRRARDVAAMSASHPITTELVHHNEPIPSRMPHM